MASVPVPAIEIHPLGRVHGGSSAWVYYESGGVRFSLFSPSVPPERLSPYWKCCEHGERSSESKGDTPVQALTVGLHHLFLRSPQDKAFAIRLGEAFLAAAADWTPEVEEQPAPAGQATTRDPEEN
jgi:hypothetical protein